VKAEGKERLEAVNRNVGMMGRVATGYSSFILDYY